MQTIIDVANTFLEEIDAKFSYDQLVKYIERNIATKTTLNQLLGLNEQNNYTVTIPVNTTHEDLCLKYNYVFQWLNNILCREPFNYHSLDLAKGTIVSSNNQTMRLTRVINKHKKYLEDKTCRSYRYACSQLGILDLNFDSIGPRLGELANGEELELFITSSIAEFMMVNHHSAYTSCYRHAKFTSSSHWTGTLSYGIDDFTLLVGVRRVKDKYKLGRSWMWVFPMGFNSYLIQPKSYGEFNELHREIVREYIQKAMYPTEQWESFEQERLSCYNRYGYVDNYDLTISVVKDSGTCVAALGLEDKLWCLDCGASFSLEGGNGLCGNCSDDFEYYCECCDIGLHEDDVYSMPNGDGYLCASCYSDNYFYCEHCYDEYNHEVAVTVIGARTTERMCLNCAEHSSGIFLCDACGDFYFDNIEHGEESDGHILCVNCIVGKCIECGVAFRSKREFNEVNGEVYCDCCYENLDTQEEAA